MKLTLGKYVQRLISDDQKGPTALVPFMWDAPVEVIAIEGAVPA